MRSLECILSDPSFKTFREMDGVFACSKGAAFRAFKALGATLVEGQHFHCCDQRIDGEAFDALEASGRLYRGTVNGVLLAPAAQAAIAALLNSAGHSPGA